MVKKLTKHGNSLALIIDRPILDLLGIDADTPLQITTDGRGLKVAPAVDDERATRFEQALARGNTKYGEVLRRLGQQ
jgi:antitoxin component of MazEF toxin-antitoxin module